MNWNVNSVPSPLTPGAPGILFKLIVASPASLRISFESNTRCPSRDSISPCSTSFNRNSAAGNRTLIASPANSSFMFFAVSVNVTEPLKGVTNSPPGLNNTTGPSPDGSGVTVGCAGCVLTTGGGATGIDGFGGITTGVSISAFGTCVSLMSVSLPDAIAA